MTTINNIADLLKILQEQPEWAEAIRSALFSQEMLDLPARFARFVELTEENHRLINARLDRLDEQMAQMQGQINQMQGQIAQMQEQINQVQGQTSQLQGQTNQMQDKLNQVSGRLDLWVGREYEYKVNKNIYSIAGQQLGLRRVQVLRSTVGYPNQLLAELIEPAADRQLINFDEEVELHLADLIFTGHSRQDRSLKYMVAEISITLGDSDLERAVTRARILEKVTGQPVTPVAICAHADQARREQVEEGGITLALLPEG